MEPHTKIYLVINGALIVLALSILVFYFAEDHGLQG